MSENHDDHDEHDLSDHEGHGPADAPGLPDDLPPDAPDDAGDAPTIHLHSPKRGRPSTRPSRQEAAPAAGHSYEQRLLILDVWRRCGLSAGDFAPLVGLSKFTLYEWKRRFEADGPAGLADRPRGTPT